MIIVRYFCLLQIYHWLTFYKQNPVAFLIGVVLFPYHLITRLMYPVELHKDAVLLGVSALKSYWQQPDAILPPNFMKKKFLALETELKS